MTPGKQDGERVSLLPPTPSFWTEDPEHWKQRHLSAGGATLPGVWHVHSETASRPSLSLHKGAEAPARPCSAVSSPHLCLPDSGSFGRQRVGEGDGVQDHSALVSILFLLPWMEDDICG